MLETCRKPLYNQSEKRWKPFGVEANRKPVLLPRTNYFPVLLCTTKLAQTTSQYYIALQIRYSTTVCYKSCTNTFPVLQHTTHLAQTSFSITAYYKSRTKSLQYYRILQSLHKHVPVLPYTTKSAQTRCSTTVYHKTYPNTFQYYSIVRISRKVAPVLTYTTKYRHRSRCSSTVYYTASTNTFPVPLCTTKPAQSRCNTIVYCKACTKSLPVPPYTTKPAQTRSSTYRILQNPRTPDAVLSYTTKFQICTNTFQY